MRFCSNYLGYCIVILISYFNLSFQSLIMVGLAQQCKKKPSINIFAVSLESLVFFEYCQTRFTALVLRLKCTLVVRPKKSMSKCDIKWWQNVENLRCHIFVLSAHTRYFLCNNAPQEFKWYHALTKLYLQHIFRSTAAPFTYVIYIVIQGVLNVTRLYRISTCKFFCVCESVT